MATQLAKVRKTAKQPPATRMCLKCHVVRPLSEFYSNRDWIEQAGKDAWCKKCISQLKTKDEMREYFFANNRKWDEAIWTAAQKKAALAAAKNTVYQKSSEDRRETILETLTCQMVPTVMQIKYSYVDNSQDINIQSYEDAKQAGNIVEMGEVKKKDPNVKTYNAFFNGDFKPAEVEYLTNYYNSLDEDFNLTDISLRDNAKKLAKAAMMVDKLQNDFAASRCSMQDLTNAITLYNTLMNMGNFAASKRKPDEKGGMSSWAETTAYLETNGHPCVRKIEWEPDAIDQVVTNLSYIIESLRGESEDEPA